MHLDRSTKIVTFRNVSQAIYTCKCDSFSDYNRVIGLLQCFINVIKINDIGKIVRNTVCICFSLQSSLL